MLVKKILIVEDDNAINDAFKMLLTSKGYEVDDARNGKEALAFTKDNHYDLILLDLLMPIMDGREFLKQFTGSKKTKIIVLSNFDTQSEIEEVYDLGAEKYFLKSWVGPKRLVSIVESYL